MKKMKQAALFCLMLALPGFFWQAPAYAVVVQPSEILSLEFTNGDMDWRGRHGHKLENLFGHKLDRLMDEPGLLVMGEYQPGPDIVDPITRGQRTYSLFTSGVQGASAPSATIDGSSITADLSSLYFADSRGDSFIARNIGGIARGIFNPDTREFYLTWDHLFGERQKSGLATFSLYGKVNMVDVAAVPLATTAVLFSTGLAVLIAVWRRKGTTQMGNMVQSA
ncbi:MAG: hypothetical protein E8D46_07700 [Nitrospira sp.]|nr:MAG: hypothetical protein E8D46_07700 [Nitrospira sp.]